MSAPRLAFSNTRNVQPKAPRSDCRNTAERSQHGVVWAIDESGYVRVLESMGPDEAAPGCMFLLAGPMSRQTTARLLSLLARELVEDGRTH